MGASRAPGGSPVARAEAPARTFEPVTKGARGNDIARRVRRRLLGRRADWSPERACRYLPIVRLLEHEAQDGLVLEVGVGDGGLGPYWGRPFVGLDLDVPHGFAGLMPVRASVLALPFGDAAFPVVLCVDVLEHLEPGDRPRAIVELLRVSGRRLVVGVPTGEAAERQDAQLDALYQRVHGCRHPFLVEHVEHGLPRREDLESWATSAAGDAWTLTTVPNAPIWARGLLMRLWIKGGALRRLTEAVLVLMASRVAALSGREHYRTLLVAERREPSP